MQSVSQKRRFEKQIKDFEGIIIYPKYNETKEVITGIETIRASNPSEFIRGIIVAIDSSYGFTGYRQVDDFNKIVIMSTSDNHIQYYTTTDTARLGDNTRIKAAYQINRWLINSYGFSASVETGEYTAIINFDDDQSIIIGFNKPDDKNKERVWIINHDLDEGLMKLFKIEED